MMTLLQSVIFMMLLSFFIQYYVMSVIMTNDLTNIRNSLGKVYMSGIMALLMGIVEVAMNDYYMNMISAKYYIVLFILLGTLYYMYKTQQYIYDIDYLNEMIEHHSMALTTSGEILKKTSDPKVKILASKIINTQEDEIQYMKSLLGK
uniref:DUF305 domain-containing protein n=1 Tax=viral metagenome TaxID=1070528 RepID=A0A6C0BXX4_9ZZZZ